MKSELTDEFIECFADLPERVQKTARKNYKIWKQNPSHPSLAFKKLNTDQPTYSVRAGIGWRAVGVMKVQKQSFGFGSAPTATMTNCLKTCKDS